MHMLATSGDWPQFLSGDPIRITGELITCRDGVLNKIFIHKSEQAKALFAGKIIYFCGPTPAPPGRVIGSCGPTTSSRMEPYFEQLCQAGVRALIGKGQISADAAQILAKYKVPYFVGIGGAGALLATKVRAAEVIAYPELGTEAVYRLEVEDFPAVVG